MDKIERTDEEWREILTPEQYQVLRQAGTWPLGLVGAACEIAALALLLVALRRRRPAARRLEIEPARAASQPVR